MKELAIRLWQPRVRISSLLTVSLMAMLFCFINLPIIFVGLIELAVLTGCVVLFRKVDITQYEVFQYKPHRFWRICEWYWTIWISYNFIYKSFLLVYPNILHKLTILFNTFGENYCKYMLCFIILAFTFTTTFYFCRFIFCWIAQFVKTLTQTEKYIIVLSFLMLVIILCAISTKTSFFACPTNKDLYVNECEKQITFLELYGDLYWGSDTLHFLNEPRYIRVADEFRHPYFSFIFPLFAPIIWLGSHFYHLVFSSLAYSFALSLATVQIFLYIITAIMLKRIFGSFLNTTFRNILFLCYLCSFPVTFVFEPERLIFTSFLLVLSIYAILQNSTYSFGIVSSISAIGATCLSIIPIGLAYFFSKQVKTTIFLIAFLGIIILGGKYMSSKTENNINRCFIFCSNASPLTRMTQYNCFLVSNFHVPSWKPQFKTNSTVLNKSTTSILLKQCNNKWIDNIAGLIITFLIVNAMLLYHVKPLVHILFYWWLISILIIGVLGFGNNECVLYCSYFSWAIIPLTLLPFYWLWQKFPKLPIPQALYAFATYLAISNLYFLYQVVQIVSDRYIVPPGM